jgi:hypothetical protein
MEGNAEAPARARRRTIEIRMAYLAAAIASGYVVALVLGLLVVDAQVRGWSEDAIIIGEFATHFNGTARSLRSLLATRDIAWANESWIWLGTAWEIAFHAERRGVFPSGRALNLTFPNLECARGALANHVIALQTNMSLLAGGRLEYLDRVADIYRNVSADLDDVRWPQGADPLAQLGPNRIRSVRDAIGEIRSLSDPHYGHTSCP